MKNDFKNLLIFSIGTTIAFNLVPTLIINSTPPGDIYPKKRPSNLTQIDLKNYQEKINSGIKRLEYLKHHPQTFADNISEKSISRILEESEKGEGESNSEFMIFFCFSSLIIGSILKEVKKKTNIPYTPMVLIVGALIGFYHQKFGKIGDSMNTISQINPHTLMVIFIPGLLFEGAYNTHGYTFNKSKWQVLLLAGPGVVMTAFAVAYSFKYVFKYNNLSISEALVIG